MAADFPAAHSMDTSWYAVDPAGHVALFESGENGNAPVRAESHFFLNDLFRARHPDLAEWQLPERPALAEEFGFYLYEYGDAWELIVPYERRVMPPHPAHVDQLSPQIRTACKKIRVPVPFARARWLQPTEFTPCDYWSPESWDAYVASDGVTVRPMRGREGRFADFVRRFRADFPDEATRYRFEGVDDGA
jgi:hypothetical protein